jgi:hypothetical protein
MTHLPEIATAPLRKPGPASPAPATRRGRSLILVTLTLAATALACNLSSLGTAVEEGLLPIGANPMLVTLARPASGGAYPVGGAVPIGAEAIGAEPIVSLELWVDGALAEVADRRGEGQTFVRQTWDWTVPSVGGHLLIVRAVDRLGRTADSEVVRLVGIPDVGYRVLVSPPEGVLPGAPVGELEFIAVPGRDAPAPAPVQLPPPPQDVEAAASAPSSLGEATSPPAAPLLTLSPNGCSTRLYITDQAANEAGFYVYRVTPGGGLFTRIATLGAHAGSGAIAYDAPKADGKQQFYASAFNAAGEAASNLVPFEPPGACAEVTEGLHIEGDTLVLPEPIDLAYLYYSLELGKWDRLPADSHAYFEPSTDSVALGALLKGKQIVLEAWGWKDGQLVYLGSLQHSGAADLPPSLPSGAGAGELLGCPASSCKGDVGKTLWTDVLTIGQLGPRSFRWMAPVEGTQGGLWQVSASPFGASCSLSPEDLLLSDLIPSSGGLTTFPIDLSPLAPKPLSASEQAQSALGTGGPIVAGLPGLNQNSVVEMQGSPAVVQQGSVFSPVMVPLLSDTDPSIPHELLLPRYYVRVLPVQNGKPRCEPSSTVTVVYDPAPQEQIKFAAPDYSRYVSQYSLQITAYDPPIFPDENLWGCIDVLEVETIPGNLLNNAWASRIGDTICPKSWSGDNQQGFSGFLDDLSEAWDYVVDLYEELEGLVKEFVAKFNPLCMQAEFAADAVGSGDAKTTIQDACKIGASIAIEAAKAYVGIPPSLPKWDQLDDLGKDYLVELAADEFTANTGIPCDDECKDLMRDGVDLAHDSLSAGSSSGTCTSAAEAHEHGVEPLCPPAGVKYRAALGAEYIPPIAWLQVTRLANSGNAPDPEPFPGCATSVTMTSRFDFPGGNVYGPYSPTGTPAKVYPAQSMTAHPYQGTSAKIPRLAPGEQVTIAVPFSQPLPVLFPWTKEMYQGYQEVPNAHGYDFYDAALRSTVTLQARTYWPEYEAMKQSGQYPGATANLPCGAMAERTFPPAE